MINQVLPKRIDWKGQQHSRNFVELSSQTYANIPSNFLLQLCNQTRYLLDDHTQSRFSKMNSLLGAGQFSAIQDISRLKYDRKTKATKIINSNLSALPQDLYINYHTLAATKKENKISSKNKNGNNNLLFNLNRREMYGNLPPQGIIQPDLFKSVNIHKRILGHLAAVYCVSFDRTGRYIITGADDNLIKAWNVFDARLMATFRGHEKEISDLTINYENTLLASGSCDKSIRIWKLKTTECLTVLNGHSSMVTSLEFSPSSSDNYRWLASSGNDGVICFWRWDATTLQFNEKPKKFIEKSRPGGQMLCLSFSCGGTFLVAGSNDHAIRVYHFENNEPSKLFELETHSNLVDSIQYANLSPRFLSGSRDGSARIWKYEDNKWIQILIDVSKSLKKTTNFAHLTKYNVTMVKWNCDDSLVITAQNNFLIKVWNSNDGQLIHELKGHNAEVFVLEAHPKDPRLLISSGHDGNVIIWNLLTGKIIKKFYNRIESQGHGCLFDTKWSPTMDMFAATDSHGYLTLFGFGGSEKYQRVPNEQFFHTDYRPLMRDANGFVLDEQTHQSPHLMPPPFLIDAEGNPYSAEFQRLVPGRGENANYAELNPQVIINDRGMPEIIADGDLDDDTPPANVANRNDDSDTNGPTLTFPKDLIQPLDSVTLRTNETVRLAKMNSEIDYFDKELKKQKYLKEKKDYDFTFDRINKTCRGKMARIFRFNESSGAPAEIVIKNVKNVPTNHRSIFDTENEVIFY
jgi:WD40 repeat protein